MFDITIPAEDLYQVLSNPDCDPVLIVENMFECPLAVIENPALSLLLLENPCLIQNAVALYPNCRLELINHRGCDPEHPITKAAIAINADIQLYIDAMEDSIDPNYYPR
jgi:hypothetical protein